MAQYNPTAVENFTRVAPDSTGDRIRTNELTLLQSDGTRITVSMQIIGISDREGNLIGVDNRPFLVDSTHLGELLENLTEEIVKLRTVMQLAHGITLD